MSGTVNKVILLGNVARDPDIRTMTNGSALANFTLATSEAWKDKATGEKRERTEWNRVSVFNPHLVKIIEQYVKKGTRLYLEGELRTRKWIDKQGEDRFSTEIVLTQYGGVMNIESLPNRGGDTGGRAPREPSGTDQRGNPQYTDDEIPF